MSTLVVVEKTSTSKNSKSQPAAAAAAATPGTAAKVEVAVHGEPEETVSYYLMICKNLFK